MSSKKQKKKKLEYCNWVRKRKSTAPWTMTEVLRNNRHLLPFLRLHLGFGGGLMRAAAERRKEI